MTSSVETKIVSMLDALQHGIVTVGEKAVKYSPDIADAALSVTQITGAAELLYGIGQGIALFLCVKFCLFFYKTAVEDDSFGAGLAVAGFASASVGLAISVIYAFFNVWNYVAIFNPKIYIAHQIIEKVMK